MQLSNVALHRSCRSPPCVRAGSDALHVDMKLFSGNDYRLAWLLAIPAWNWLKGTWQRLRNGGGEGEGTCRAFLLGGLETGKAVYP